MPTTRSTRTIAAPVDELWKTIRDPHHLPRWWPRVSRVEDVTEDAFTEVLKTAKGRVVRADFVLAECDEPAGRLRWEQRLEGSPFARVLRSARTEVRLTPVPPSPGPVGAEAARAGSLAPARGALEGQAGEATEVTIELDHQLVGFTRRFGLLSFAPRLGSYMVKRAAAKTIDEALDGLERISG